MRTRRSYVKTPDTTTTALSSARPSTAMTVQEQIKTKMNTFMNWNLNQYLKIHKNSKNNKKQQIQAIQKNNLIDALLKYANDMKKKQKLFKNKNEQLIQKSANLMENHRQRFKKINNPLQIFQFYNRHHKFAPNQYQKIIMDKFLQISALIKTMQNINIQKILDDVYKLMNMAVDFNQKKLFVLSIVLAADICMELKQFRRATYFYNQARLAGIYSSFFEITIEALIGLSKISFELDIFGAVVVLLKKALAFAWKLKNYSTQIQIYDLLGQAYCLEGKMQQAKYYHQRFSQSQVERQQSAIRKIYIEIIKDDIKAKNLKFYNENIDVLFLQSLNLPIYSFNKIPPFQQSKQFNNYVNGFSPRKDMDSNHFQDQFIQDAQTQLRNIVLQNEFTKQMPDPDTQVIFVPKKRPNKFRKEIQFNRTLQFHQILGKKIQISQPQTSKRYSLQKQMEMAMSKKPDLNWEQRIKKVVKYERVQKLGSLRDPVRKSHLKTHERRRSMSFQSQKLKNSVNKAILSWIDPAQQ